MATKLFISYCWKQRKDAVREMARFLRTNFKFDVWIDANDMAGSTLEAMAQGIDEAAIVLIFICEDYKTSENCKREAEYALMQKKLILPVRVQRNTQINGWLGMILGQRLWVDYSENSDFQTAANGIVQQIQLLLSDKQMDGNIPVPVPATKPALKFKTIDVPCFAKYYERKTEEERILGEIRKICQKPKEGMLVITGGGGVGKTSLIAHLFTEEGNHDFLQRDCKVQTSIWLNCFQWRDQDAFDEAAEQAFIAKLLQLVQRAVGGEGQRFFGLDGAVNYFERESRRLIFILDDVYNVKILETLFRQCSTAPCCAVTRDLTTRGPVNFIKKMCPIEELSDEAIADMLANSYELKNKLSKTQIRHLSNRCCRLPLIASLIAARFDDCFDYATEYQLVASERLSDFGIDGPHETVLQLFEFSVERMEPKLRKSYQAFLLFDPAEPVLIEDLAILWGFIGGDAKIKASALCNMLEKKSLTRRLVKGGDDNDDKTCYLVHQLLYEAAFENARKEAKIDPMENFDKFASELRLKIVTGESFVTTTPSAAVNNRNQRQAALRTDQLTIVCEAIKQQRRGLLERIVRMISAEDLVKLFGAKSKQLTGGATFLRHLYASSWSDNITSKNVKRLYGSVNHSYRLIATLLNKVETNNVDYIQLFREKHPSTGETLLFELYDGSSAYFDEIKPIKQLVNKWRNEYEEEKWIKEQLNEKQNPLINEILNWNGRKIDFPPPPNSNCDSALMIACRLDRLDLVKTLVDKDPSLICQEGEEGRTALMYAARNDNFHVVKYLVEKDAKCSKLQDVVQRTALSYAAENGHFDVVKCLVDKDLVAMQDYDGRSALMYAAMNGHFDIVRLLYDVTKMQSLQCQDRDGSNALMLATINGHVETAQFLFDKRPETAAIVDGKNRNSLMLAAMNGHMAVLTLFAEKMPELLRVEDSNRANALFLAAENGHFDVVRFIFDLNEELVQQRDVAGRTALMAAAKNGHTDVVAFLVEKVPTIVKVVDYKGETALSHGVESGLLVLVTLLYLHWPEALKAQNTKGTTALMLAADNGDADIVRFLANKLTPPHDFKLCNKNGASAFSHACKSGNIDCVRILYDKWQEAVTTTDVNGWTPLIVAVANNRLEVVKFLLEKCPPTMIHQSGGTDSLTPFLIAVNYGHYEMVKYLYTHNNDVVKARTADGLNALCLAVKNDRFPIVKFLTSSEEVTNLTTSQQDRNEMLKSALDLSVLTSHSSIETYLCGLISA